MATGTDPNINTPDTDADDTAVLGQTEELSLQLKDMFLQHTHYPDGSVELTFVKQRNNSYGLSKAEEQFAQLLEQAGLAFFVRYKDTLISLEEFQKGGVHSVSITGINDQTRYNYNNQVKKMQARLEQLSPNHPQYKELQTKIDRKRAQIAAIERAAKGEATDKLLDAFKQAIDYSPEATKQRALKIVEDYKAKYGEGASNAQDTDQH